MLILGIETSCDETSVGIVEDGVKILSLSTLSSLKFHRKTGGVIPEIAAREQVKAIIPALNQALEAAFPSSTLGSSSLSSSGSTRGSKNALDKIDAIAVTYGPGLIGSLLVGVETARTLSYLFNKPLIPVNHLLGHIYAAFIKGPTQTSSELRTPSFPFVSLVVSGGHTDLLYFESHDKYKWLGGTLDDAAGECLDKVGRLVGFPYPAGADIDKAAKEVGNSDKYKLPRPLTKTKNFDFSFSGLKTAAVTLANKNPDILGNKQSLISNEIKRIKSEFVSSLQEAIFDVLISKSVSAAKELNCPTIVVGGGVSANSRLRERFRKEFDGEIFFPEVKLSGDNGAMIASAAFFQGSPLPWSEVKANPNLYFG